MADVERRVYATEIIEEIKALREAVSALTLNQAVLEQMLKGVVEREKETKTSVEHLNKIVITGNGVPSIQENIRTMVKTLNDFIAQVTHDHEEEHAIRTAAAKLKADRDYAERNRWKWVIIGLITAGVPTFILFIYQFVMFWTKVVIPDIK